MSMTDRDQNGGGLPPEDAAEIKTFKKLGAALPKEECDWPTLNAGCQKAQAKLEKLDHRREQGLYQSTQQQFQMLCAAHAYPDVMASILEAAAELDIEPTAATSTALLIVKVYSGNRLEPATASQRARALRGAAMKKIKPHKLAKHLEKEGIAKLAKYFSDNKEPKRTKPKSQPAKSDRATSDCDFMEEVKLFNPTLEWSEGHRDTWDKALRKGRRVRVILKPDGDNSGRVKAIRVLSTSKKREGRHDA